MQRVTERKFCAPRSLEGTIFRLSISPTSPFNIRVNVLGTRAETFYHLTVITSEKDEILTFTSNIQARANLQPVVFGFRIRKLGNPSRSLSASQSHQRFMKPQPAFHQRFEAIHHFFRSSFLTTHTFFARGSQK